MSMYIYMYIYMYMSVYVCMYAGMHQCMDVLLYGCADDVWMCGCVCMDVSFDSPLVFTEAHAQVDKVHLHAQRHAQLPKIRKHLLKQLYPLSLHIVVARGDVHRHLLPCLRRHRACTARLAAAKNSPWPNVAHRMIHSSVGGCQEKTSTGPVRFTVF